MCYWVEVLFSAMLVQHHSGYRESPCLSSHRTDRKLAKLKKSQPWNLMSKKFNFWDLSLKKKKRKAHLLVFLAISPVFKAACVYFLPSHPPIAISHCWMGHGKHNSLRSFSSDRSYTLNRSSYARDSMMIEELLVPSKEQVCVLVLCSSSLQQALGPVTAVAEYIHGHVRVCICKLGGVLASDRKAPTMP